MLVLSRHKNERIHIGEDIIVTVVEIRSDKCRIGIEAPSGIPVHRHEIWLALKREAAQAEQTKIE